MERVDAECVITLERACELLSAGGKKITPQTHWVRVTHDITRDAKPWEIVRMQAISRSLREGEGEP